MPGPRQRTLHMWRQLKQSPPAHVKRGKFFVGTTPYEIVTRDTTDFCSPVAYIGASVVDPNREYIITHPSDRIRRSKEYELRELLIGEPDDACTRLQKTATFVQHCFPDSNQEALTQLLSTCQGEHISIPGNISIPIVPLDEFLLRGIGVCRQYALLTAVSLAHLQHRNLLPAGKITLYRANTEHSAHACVVFTEEATQRHYVIDATQKDGDTVREIANLAGSPLARSLGPAFYDALVASYGGEEALPPTLPIGHSY